MSRQTKRRDSCNGCERPFSDNSIHQCPARDWQCNVCDQFGHLDGFCEWYSGGAISFNVPLEETAHQYRPLIQEEGVLECSSCDRPYTQEHDCPARYSQRNACYKYGHLDGLCDVYGSKAIVFDFSLGENACPYGPDEIEKLLDECKGCRRPYSKLHICPSRDWQCGYCDMYGHLDGLCEVLCGEAISFNFPREQFANPHEPVKFEEFSESMDREATCEAAYEGATLQVVKQEHYANPGMCNTRKRSAEHSEHCDKSPGQKRQRCTDPAKQELNFFINRVEALRKENQALKKKWESAKKIITRLSIKIKGEKSLVKDSNSLTQTGQELYAGINQMKTEKTKLFEYSQKLEAYTRKVATQVDHLTSDHRYIMDRAYPGWPTETLPPWSKGRCRRCGSSKRHEEVDCIANGHVCSQCFKINHFTAVCRNTPSHTMTASKKEKKLIAKVKADIAASK